MPIDFNIGDEVVTSVNVNGDGSACLRLAKQDGSHAVNVVGVRPDGKVQRFTVGAADAAALGLVLDASGFVEHVG